MSSYVASSDLTGVPKISVSGKFSPLKCDAVEHYDREMQLTKRARFCNINTFKGAKSMCVF